MIENAGKPNVLVAQSTEFMETGLVAKAIA